MAVSEWLRDMGEATRKTFDCQVCLESEADEVRNCCGDYPEHMATAKFNVWGHRMTQCPVSVMQPWASEAMHLVSLCSGEMGGLSRLPIAGGVLDQSSHFYEVRSVVLGEQQRIEAERQKRRDAPKGK